MSPLRQPLGYVQIQKVYVGQKLVLPQRIFSKYERHMISCGRKQKT